MRRAHSMSLALSVDCVVPGATSKMPRMPHMVYCFGVLTHAAAAFSAAAAAFCCCLSAARLQQYRLVSCFRNCLRAVFSGA